MAGKAETTEKSSGNKKKLPIMIIAGVVVLVLVLFLAKGMLGGSKADAKEKKKESHQVGISFALDEFLVNLSGSGDHYLRASISLGMKKGQTEEKLKEHTALMRDAILSVLTSKTKKELAEAREREELKEELKKRINEALGEEQVVKVYFTSFATQ